MHEQSQDMVSIRRRTGCWQLSAAGGAAVVSDRAQEAKNVQRAFLGAMETQMQIGAIRRRLASPADLTERERTELQTAYTSRVEQYYTEENPCRKRYIALNEDFLTACDSDVEYSESGGVADCRFDSDAAVCRPNDGGGAGTDRCLG